MILIFSLAVEKVVIDHSSMGDAMNALRDGSYQTISRINFAALDTISAKPIGIYGSKSAIVQFLRHLGVVDETTSVAISVCPFQRTLTLTSPILRSVPRILESQSIVVANSPLTFGQGSTFSFFPRTQKVITPFRRISTLSIGPRMRRGTITHTQAYRKIGLPSCGT